MSAEEHKDDSDMHINPQRAKDLAENLAGVLQRIQAANKSSRNVRLIAVSKLKPANDILALHRSPSHHVHFGENYAQELQEKAQLLPRSIKWHFIGALQSNKCRPLAEAVPNLFCVGSVDSAKKASALDKGRATAIERSSSSSSNNDPSGSGNDDDGKVGRLNVHVQINTSGEAEKSGVQPGADTVGLCRHVRDECPNLQLAGLMTIGAIARSRAVADGEENEDFVALTKARAEVERELGLEQGELELSMGMSADFEGAIALGSDEVRVGTGIFGERPARKDAIVKEEAEEGKS